MPRSTGRKTTRSLSIDLLTLYNLVTANLKNRRVDIIIAATGSKYASCGRMILPPTAASPCRVLKPLDLPRAQHADRNGIVRPADCVADPEDEHTANCHLMCGEPYRRISMLIPRSSCKALSGQEPVSPGSRICALAKSPPSGPEAVCITTSSCNRIDKRLEMEVCRTATCSLIVVMGMQLSSVRASLT